jgi:exopolysaccharide biosynthesis WecB/TagA/CpsF family protein
MTTNERTTWPAFRSCGVRIDAVPLHDAARMIVDGRFEGGAPVQRLHAVVGIEATTQLAQVLEQGHAESARWDAAHLDRQAAWADHMTERVYGPDLMQLVLERGQASGLRHYLYGSTPEVLAALQNTIAARWPDALIAGVESPPFRAITDSELRQSVARAQDVGADVVWVGMGTPAQDTISRRMAEIAPATYVAVGAAFDFIGGTKKQAPQWMQRSGLEWSYRMATEPKRLWRRYLIGNATFAAAPTP